MNCDYIIRSAGSHTPIDLIAGNGKVVFAVQVKQGGHISKEEKLELIEWARTFIAIPYGSSKGRKQMDIEIHK